MKRILIFTAVLLLMASVSFAGYSTLVHIEQGGAKLVVESGGEIEIQSGGILDVDGTWQLGSALIFDNGGQISNTPDGDIVLTEGEELRFRFTNNNVELLSRTGVLGVDVNDLYIVFKEISAPANNPAANYGWLYVKDDGGGTTTLYFEDSDGTATSCIAGAGSPAGDDTQMQYNDNGSFGAISTIIWDDTNLEFADDQSAAFGTNTDWTVNFDDSVADQLLFETALTAAVDTGDPMIQILVDTGNANGTGMTDNQQVFGVAKGSQASNVDLFVVDEDGDATFAGSLTLGGTFYQAALASAASGNVALTIDAAGNGNITLGGTSSGNLSVQDPTTFTENVDIGNAATDTLTITAIIDGDVTLDDNDGASPSLILKDATNETATFSKADGGNITITPNAGGQSFQVLTGNLLVGNESPSVAVDGEDAYIEGTFEVDGSARFDGAVSLNSTLTAGGDITINDQVSIAFNSNDEEFAITGTATNMTAANMMTLIMAAQDSDKYILALQQTPNGDANNKFLVCEDNAGGTDLLKVEAGGETTWTLDPAADVIITAAAHTATTGVLDIDFDSVTNGAEAVNIKTTYNAGGGAAETLSALYIDLDDDADAAETLYGIRIAPSDVDGGATIVGLDLANNLDDAIVAAIGIDSQYAVVDAASAVHTETSGVWDVSFQTATNGTSMFNVDAGVGDIGDGEITHVFYIDMDDDDTADASTYNGITINASDLDGNALVQGIYIQSADAALQADKGYIRVGTGETPSETLDDDDIYIEGTFEADGKIYADAGVEIDNTLLMVATVELSNADIDDLKGTPKELVAAPGANQVLELVSALLIHDYGGTNVWTEADDNLVIEYDNGSAAAASQAIEMTSFIDQASDQITNALPKIDAMDAAADVVNKNLALLTNDDNFGGNAGNDNTMTVIITYRVHDTLGL